MPSNSYHNWILRSAIVREFHYIYKFAKRVGLHGPAITLILNGKRKLDPKTQRKWARILNSDVGELFPDHAGEGGQNA